MGTVLFPPSLYCFAGVLISSLPLVEHRKKQLNRREETLFLGIRFVKKKFAGFLEVVSASAQIGRWERSRRTSGDVAKH